MKSPIEIWRRQKINYRYLGASGRVITKTRIIEAPVGFSGPYWVVMVQVKNRRVVGQWADATEPKIGMKVVGVLRRLGQPGLSGVIEYGVKWKQVK